MPFELPLCLAAWIVSLSSPLDVRSAVRVELLLVGILFAKDRRTVACWLRAAGIGKGFRPFYHVFRSIGRAVQLMAGRVLDIVVENLPLGERILLVFDDSPTKRYGPCVQGAGIHHNPTPGPAGAPFLYGHVWVVMGIIVEHATWGSIALPIMALLYVRRKHIPMLPRRYHWKFQTKLQQAALMLGWAVERLGGLGKSLWAVVDGGYVKRAFLKDAVRHGVIVVGRLRRDAALWTLPIEYSDGSRPKGRPRKYGTKRIDLRKRAAHPGGWQTGEFVLYGEKVFKTYKTFLATYRPAYGTIRVVLVREADGFRAFLCTKADATVAEVLETFACRATIEQVFNQIKETHGAGQQQLRDIWANLGSYNLILWLHTLVEIWAWKLPKSRIGDRSDSPWDNADRRPSHADRCEALRRTCIEAAFAKLRTGKRLARGIATLVNRLINLVA